MTIYMNIYWQCEALRKIDRLSWSVWNERAIDKIITPDGGQRTRLKCKIADLSGVRLKSVWMEAEDTLESLLGKDSGLASALCCSSPESVGSESSM